MRSALGPWHAHSHGSHRQRSLPAVYPRSNCQAPRPPLQASLHSMLWAIRRSLDGTGVTSSLQGLGCGMTVLASFLTWCEALSSIPGFANNETNKYHRVSLMTMDQKLTNPNTNLCGKQQEACPGDKHIPPRGLSH